MNTRLMRVILALVLVGIANLVPSSMTKAQVSLGVTPSLLDLSAGPGDTGEEALSISNNGNEPLTVSIAIQSYPGMPDEFSAVDWLTIAVSELELEPNTTDSVEVGLAVPDDAETGGAYAEVLISTVSDSATTQGVAIGGQLGVGVFFEIQAEDGELLRQVSAVRAAPTLELDGRIGFRGEVSNDGNTLAAITGTMDLTQTGDDGLTASLPLQSVLILPSITTDVQAEGTLPLPAGTEWTARTTIYPGNPEEFDDLEPAEVETTFVVEPQLEYTASICENLDRGPTVTLDLSNTGTIGLVPEVSIELVNGAGEGLATIRRDQNPVAWPGDHVVTPIEGLDPLVGGDYTLQVFATIVRGLDPVVVEVPFSIGGFGDNVAPLCGSEPDATPAD